MKHIILIVFALIIISCKKETVTPLYKYIADNKEDSIQIITFDQHQFDSEDFVQFNLITENKCYSVKCNYAYTAGENQFFYRWNDNFITIDNRNGNKVFIIDNKLDPGYSLSK